MKANIRSWIVRHKTRLLQAGVGVVVVLVVVQLFYPGDTMLPFSRVDSVAVGGLKKSDATSRLDKQATSSRLIVALQNSNKRFDEPKLSDVGVSVSNKDRIEQLVYPWYLRIMPGSLLWYGLIQGEDNAEYNVNETTLTSYLAEKLGEDCLVPAKDATLQLNDERLQVVPSTAGADCQTDRAIDAFKKAVPKANKNTVVTIPATPIAPGAGDDDAQRLADQLNRTTDGGIALKVVDKTQTVPRKEVLSWLTFKTVEQGVGYDIDQEKASAYFSKSVTPLVAKPAGITKVTTADFTETSRLDGASGQTLNIDATLKDVREVLDDNKEVAQAQVASLAPKVEYTRTYSRSSTGIAAQLKFYDDDNQGVFGVSFSELGGQGLTAKHNADRQFVTASTYKLFVAFSTIKRVEGGQMKWDDANIAGGRNLSTCFDDMIVKSDNACAEALIKKIGAKDLNADIKSLGLTNTAFRADNNVTTANDLSNYLTQLERGTMPIKPENRDRLLGAMKRNVYRQGVPAGASGQVADKVGFLWGLLHDATIVYSPKGTYVLVVLTDGSSWANIADLTRKIEALR